MLSCGIGSAAALHSLAAGSLKARQPSHVGTNRQDICTRAKPLPLPFITLLALQAAGTVVASTANKPSLGNMRHISCSQEHAGCGVLRNMQGVVSITVSGTCRVWCPLLQKHRGSHDEVIQVSQPPAVACTWIATAHTPCRTPLQDPPLACACRWYSRCCGQLHLKQSAVQW